MKKITLLLALSAFTFGIAQTNLEDFESTPIDFSGFEGLGGANVVSNPSVDGNNGSATVGELIVVQAGNPWQGANLIMQDNYIDVSDPATKPVTVQVYSTTSFTMLARLAGGQSGAVDSAADATHSGSGWETLTFTFNENLDGTGSANGEYETLALFPNWTGSGWNDPEIEITVYVDNITAFAGNAISGPPPPPAVAAPTPPARDPSDVISLYSNAYSSVGLNNVPWDAPTEFTEIMIDGNETLQIDFGTFMGSSLGSVVDATAMTHFHIDFYVADAWIAGQVFNQKLSNHTGGGGETNAGELTIALPGDGSQNQTWVSIDVPLTDFTAGISPREALTEYLITPSGLVSVAYIDNVYLHKNTTLSTESFEKGSFKVFPNPTNNTWNIKSDNQNIQSVVLYDVLGKKVYTTKANDTEVIIESDNLSKGLYFAKITTPNGESNIRLIKN